MEEAHVLLSFSFFFSAQTNHGFGRNFLWEKWDKTPKSWLPSDDSKGYLSWTLNAQKWLQSSCWRMELGLSQVMSSQERIKLPEKKIQSDIKPWLPYTLSKKRKFHVRCIKCSILILLKKCHLPPFFFFQQHQQIITYMPLIHFIPCAESNLSQKE